MPSTPGMRTSISTTSGTNSATLADGVVAVLGLGDDVDVGLGLEHHDQTPTEQGVVVADHHPDPVVGLRTSRSSSPLRRTLRKVVWTVKGTDDGHGRVVSD